MLHQLRRERTLIAVDLILRKVQSPVEGPSVKQYLDSIIRSAFRLGLKCIEASNIQAATITYDIIQPQ